MQHTDEYILRLKHTLIPGVGRTPGCGADGLILGQDLLCLWRVAKLSIGAELI
jgi:hypothetical protein